MEKAFELQPWITLRGNTTSTIDIVQPRNLWADAYDCENALIGVQILKASSCTLYLETGIKEEGPWSVVSSWGATASTNVMLDIYDTPTLQRFIRWRISKGAADWEACFKLNVRLK